MRKMAERARAEGEARSVTLFRFLRLRLKSMRYGHVSASKIYAESEA